MMDAGTKCETLDYKITDAKEGKRRSKTAIVAEKLERLIAKTYSLEKRYYAAQKRASKTDTHKTKQVG
jgi:hypothetical protein